MSKLERRGASISRCICIFGLTQFGHAELRQQKLPNFLRFIEGGDKFRNPKLWPSCGKNLEQAPYVEHNDVNSLFLFKRLDFY